MFSNAEEVLAFIKDEDVKFIDIRFCDLPGVMQHFNVPAASFDEDAFNTGQMFDGSSIRGFKSIHESDMKLIPDPQTAYLDPYRTEKTLIMNFSIVDPFTDEPYERDPRQIARKAEEHLRSTGSEHAHRDSRRPQLHDVVPLFVEPAHGVRAHAIGLTVKERNAVPAMIFGRKGAERLIIELRDKVGALAPAPSATGDTGIDEEMAGERYIGHRSVCFDSPHGPTLLLVMRYTTKSHRCSTSVHVGSRKPCPIAAGVFSNCSHVPVFVRPCSFSRTSGPLRPRSGYCDLSIVLWWLERRSRDLGKRHRS